VHVFLSRITGHVSLACLALFIALVPAPPPLAAPTERQIRIEAGSFNYTPAVIAVNPGDRVTLELASADVVHGLYLDGYGLSLVAEPGQTAQLTFAADRPGSFRFRCSVTCGPLHPFMIGKLVVGPNWLMYRAVGLSVLSVIAGLWLLRNRPSPIRDAKRP
jgi:heme/copper-type cytochrome/quinol oxidase subunit 2